LVFDTQEKKVSGEIAVGDNPNELLLNGNGSVLFVANANDNSVSVIDIKSRKVLEVLNAALYGDAPAGSTSNGLALSASGKNLYVAMQTTIAWLFLMSLCPAEVSQKVLFLWVVSYKYQSNW
jgi:YVTN family beta-propeller protein